MQGQRDFTRIDTLDATRQRSKDLSACSMGHDDVSSILCARIGPLKTYSQWSHWFPTSRAIEYVNSKDDHVWNIWSRWSAMPLVLPNAFLASTTTVYNILRTCKLVAHFVFKMGVWTNPFQRSGICCEITRTDEHLIEWNPVEQLIQHFHRNWRSSRYYANQKWQLNTNTLIRRDKKFTVWARICEAVWNASRLNKES